MSQEVEDVRRIPPYGPARGMLQGLQLLQRIDPTRVDEAFLRAHQIAPNNEYKVIGALQYLGLIDDLGKPTDKSRLLKTRGGAFILNLQTIVREAYAGLFRALDVKQATREDIYNYFVTIENLGAEMAVKATRFFTQVCRFAEIDLPFAQPARREVGPKPSSGEAPPRRRNAAKTRNGTPAAVAGSPFLLLITPEVASMDEDRLTDLFEKIGNALRRSGALALGGDEPPRKGTRHVD